MQINTTTTQWMAAQHNVRLELFELCKISIVAVIVSPLSKYIRSVWALQWRMALIRSYLSVWNPNREPIEGASQRVHEDTYRFSRGIDMCFTTILDSIVTLFVFVPILTRLGAETPCPRSASVFSWMGSSWLIGMATTSALVGFIITMILGHRLVRLEVQNQVGEAHMRKDLVVLEMSPATICVAYPSKQYDADDADAVNSVALMPPLPHFIPISNTLKRNYSRLFLNFCSINLWLAIFDQANTILPYMVFGPLLFNTDQEHRIMLGTLVQVANSFDKVFGSLSIIAENWGSGKKRPCCHTTTFVTAVERVVYSRSLVLFLHLSVCQSTNSGLSLYDYTSSSKTFTTTSHIHRGATCLRRGAHVGGGFNQLVLARRVQSSVSLSKCTMHRPMQIQRVLQM